eukprot:5980394-Prymnesium_polylepis.1
MAEAGDVDAMRNLAGAYISGGAGHEQDMAQGFRWGERAAKTGDNRAIGALGHCYVVGMGVEKNQSMGLVFMVESATRGNPKACYALGRLFLLGKHGLPKDSQLTRRWYEKALSCHEKALSFHRSAHSQGDTSIRLSSQDKQKAEAWLSENATGPAEWSS